MGIYEIFKWIYSIEVETEVELNETVSNLKGKIFLSKHNDGLHFKLGSPYSKLLYQKNSNFIISHNLFKIKINHFSVKNVKDDFLSRLGVAYIFKSLNFEEKGEKFYQYYSKIDSAFLISFLEENQNEFAIDLDGINFKISTCYLCQEIKHIFLCIQCDSKIGFERFKHYVNNIIVSIAFFTGSFYKLEEFYFQSQFDDFSNETNVFYRNSNTKYVFPNPITKHPIEWSWKFKNDFFLTKDIEDKWRSFIDEKRFKIFVNLLILKPKIYFSLRMLFDFYKYPSISRVSLMFVVFETLCDELNTKVTQAEKQIKQKIGIDTLNKIKDKIGIDEFKILTDIVENIDNKLTNNSVHFEQTLISLGINCSNEEKKILGKRNDFFHGKIIPNLYNVNSEEEFVNLECNYNYYSLRLYVLTSKILLKTIGFKGCLINYPKLFEDNYGMNLKEPYFIKL